MKKNRRFSASIKNRILLVSVPALVIVFSIILALSIVFFRMGMRHYMKVYIEQTQQEMAKSIELMINDVNLRCINIMRDPEIYEAADSDGGDERSARITGILRRAAAGSDTIGNIKFMTLDGESFYAHNNDEYLTLSDDALRLMIDARMVSAVTLGIARDKRERPNLMLGMKFTNFSTGRKLGYLIAYIRTDVVQKAYTNSLGAWGETYVISDGNNVILHPRQDKVGTVMFENRFPSSAGFDFYSDRIDGERSIIAVTNMSQPMMYLGLNWKMVSVIPEKRVYDMVHDLDVYMIYMEILLLIFIFLLSVFISSSLTKPLNRIRLSMSRFQGDAGSRHFISGTGGNDEIRELEQEYNNMVVRINDLIEKNNTEKEKQREFELIALQSQINPHFLYNALDTIAWLAKLRVGNVDEFVMALARFYRISLSNGDKYITVRDEINLVKCYVTIEQQRFPDKFDVIYDLDEAVLTQMILKLTLQPIVENALKHGMRAKSGHGTVKISGFIESDNIFFEVTDDGVGFDPNDKDTWKPKNDGNGGYGLRNVDERLKLEYGERYGLQIFSSPGNGTRVVVIIHIKD